MSKSVKNTVNTSKSDKIVVLARRRTGVTGSEIIEATGWPTGCAKEMVTKLANSRGFTAARYDRRDGAVAWRLAGKAA